jgi:hypothetical protein
LWDNSTIIIKKREIGGEMIINFKVISFGLFEQKGNDESIIRPSWDGHPCGDGTGVADPGTGPGKCTDHVCNTTVLPHDSCWTDGAPVYYCMPRYDVCYKDATGLRFK